MSLNRHVGYINLNTGNVRIATIPDHLNEEYIGGRGLGSYLLYNHLAAGVDPLDTDNVIVVSVGFLAGMLAPAPAFTFITSKSPLTGEPEVAKLGGFFASELRFAAFDHLLITGKASRPCCLFVHDGKIDIIDGRPVWGKDTRETQAILRERLQNEGIQVLCIGRAGETLSKIASVVSGLHSSTDGAGIGAVFSSKNLKAIVVRGTAGIEVKFPREALEYDRQLNSRICSSALGRRITRGGSVSFYNTITDGHLSLDPNPPEDFTRYIIGRDSCHGCQLRCRFRYIINKGPYFGVTSAGPEPTDILAKGTSHGYESISTMLAANDLANRYGLDNTATAYIVAMATRSGHNDNAVFEMIQRIGGQEIKDDVTSEGGTRVTKVLSSCSETPVAGSGYYGQWQGFFEEDALPLEVIPGEGVQRGFERQLCGLAADTLGICRLQTAFVDAGMPGIDEFSKLIFVNTGLELSNADVRNCAERLLTVERLLYLREDGSGHPMQPSPTDTASMTKYYGMCGWDEKGRPTPQTLMRLGLSSEPNHIL